MAIKWYEPNMTSDTNPTPWVASASTMFDATTYRAYNAFKKTLPTSYPYDCWATASGAPNGWIQLDFGSPKPMKAYKLRTRGALESGAEPYTSMVRSWVLKGSNDGTAFTVIDTRTNITNWSSTNLWNEFTLPTTVRYRYYRLEITTNNGNTRYTAIGALQFGYAIGKILFQNTTNNKFFTVANNQAVEVADGSFAVADAQGLDPGTPTSMATVTNFNTLIGSPFKVINYADATVPTVTVKENFTGRLTAKSMAVSLLGVENLMSLNAVAAGDIKHGISFNGSNNWIKFDGSNWVQIADLSQGMSTLELNALTKDQLEQARIDAVATSITFGHSLAADASITTLTLKVNMQGVTQLAPTSSYTQTFDQATKTITFNISKTGQYRINYVDSV